MKLTRRELMRASLAGAAVGALSVPAWARESAREDAERILVVVELAGGNDGLNTIVHGCGYPNPTRSHFTSMRDWHTATPGVAERTGWVGRLADARWSEGRRNALVQVARQESLALRSRAQSPIVFSTPETFLRRGHHAADPVYAEFTRDGSATGTLSFVRDAARTAEQSSALVREATSAYSTPISYGTGAAPLARDLRNVAALMAADFPARIYYVGMSGFDTHGAQNDRHNNQLMYLGDALEGFQRDLARLGRQDEVMMLVFTEFGRRVAENQSGGTDHGAAGPMWLVGSRVRGGFHGSFPSLTDLDDGDLRMTTDFRRVYASVLRGWMDVDEPAPVLRGEFDALPIFI